MYGTSCAWPACKTGQLVLGTTHPTARARVQRRVFFDFASKNGAELPEIYLRFPWQEFRQSKKVRLGCQGWR